MPLMACVITQSFVVCKTVKDLFDGVSSRGTQSLFISRFDFRQGLYDSTISDVQVTLPILRKYVRFNCNIALLFPGRFRCGCLHSPVPAFFPFRVLRNQGAHAWAYSFFGGSGSLLLMPKAVISL